MCLDSELRESENVRMCILLLLRYSLSQDTIQGIRTGRTGKLANGFATVKHMTDRNITPADRNDGQNRAENLHTATGWSRRSVLQIGGAGTLGILAGCSGRNGTSADGTTKSKSTDDDDVTIAVLSPVSGDYQALGREHRQAAELAVEYVNKSDAFDFNVSAVYRDSEGDALEARDIARSLVDTDISFIAGTIDSDVSLAVSDIAASHEVVFTPCAATDALTGAECNEYTFRHEANATMHATALVNYAVDNFGTNWWLHSEDSAYGHSAIEAVRGELTNRTTEIDIVGETLPPQRAESYTPQIEQIANSEADFLALPLTGGALVRFLIEADKADLTDEVDIMGTGIFARVARQAAGTAASGTFSVALYDPAIKAGDNQQFVSSYEQAFGNRPGNFARTGYEAVRTICRGIQAADSTDPTVVRETLSGLEMTTVLGERRFRECDHQMTSPAWVAEITAGTESEMPDVELIDRLSQTEVTPPCEQVGCTK